MPDSSFVSPALVPVADGRRTADGCSCKKCYVYRDPDAMAASGRDIEKRKQVPSTCDVVIASSAANWLSGRQTNVYSTSTIEDIGKLLKDRRWRSYESSESSLSSKNGNETDTYPSTRLKMNSTVTDDRYEANICQQQKKMRIMEYQINILRAQVRQYHTKLLWFQRLSKAAIVRDDELRNISSGILPSDEIKSNAEDDDLFTQYYLYSLISHRNQQQTLPSPSLILYPYPSLLFECTQMVS